MQSPAQAQKVGLDGGAEEGSQEKRKEARGAVYTFLCKYLGRSLLFSGSPRLQRQGEGPREAALTAETPISTSYSRSSGWARGGQVVVAGLQLWFSDTQGSSM